MSVNFEKKAGNPEQTSLFTGADGAVCKQGGSRFLQAGYQGSSLTTAPQVNRATVISASRAQLPVFPQSSAVTPGKGFLHVEVFPWSLSPK